MKSNIVNNNKDMDLLYQELSKEKPSGVIVKELIQKSSNFEDYSGELLYKAIENVAEGLELKFIKLLIDEGAKLSFEEEGFNGLFIACLMKDEALVELLLKAGMNPNCISTEVAETLLDWVEFDQFYEESEWNNGKKLDDIIALLKKYGAKNISEMFAEDVEDYLHVFSAYEPTGIQTKRGAIPIAKIPHVTPEFVTRFNTWLANNLDKIDKYVRDEKESYKIKNLPNIQRLKLHNEEGMKMAKQIKKWVGKDIEVSFFSLDLLSIKKYSVRNVNRKILK